MIVDDILDSGRTLAFARRCWNKAARAGAHLRSGRQASAARGQRSADFTGFRCPPVFVVGYGMDLAHRYRELPSLAG